jgi:hypothetical protein
LIQRRLDIEAVTRLTDIADYISALTLGAVAELGVADHLASAPCDIDRLAERCKVHKQSLLIALRGLSTKGVFEEPEPAPPGSEISGGGCGLGRVAVIGSSPQPSGLPEPAGRFHRGATRGELDCGISVGVEDANT